MSIDPFAALPADRCHAAQVAMTAVVGASARAAVRPLTGGVSGAFVFLVEAKQQRFVLRIEGVASSLRNPHQYLAMQAAADAGIAPRLHYVDADDRVAMMDFIADQPLDSYPGGQYGLAQAVGILVRELHVIPHLPRFMSFAETVHQLWSHVCKLELFGNGLLDAASERLSALRKAYVVRKEHNVPCHNDVLPRNVLFDGKRLWLIDWENAYRNDALVDVAAALDNFAPSLQLEEVLLQAWLGTTPASSLREQLALVRALTRLYYAGILFCAAAAAQRLHHDASLAALTSAEFERAIRGGQLVPETPETSLALGKMYLASFMSSAPPPGLPPMYMR